MNTFSSTKPYLSVQMPLAVHIEGTIKTVTVKRNVLGEIYLYFSVNQDVTPGHPSVGNSSRIAGFDFGLKTFLTSSTGADINHPLFFKQAQHEIEQANRELSRKVKGSTHYNQAKQKLAKTHETVKNRRKDYHFKLANRLTNDYDVLVFESLNLKGMQQRWGKKVSDLGFGAFVKIVSSYGDVKGKTVYFLDQWEPTTKPCSVCGSLNRLLRLKERTWTCPDCGTEHDRDKNAAYNIEALGRQRIG